MRSARASPRTIANPTRCCAAVGRNASSRRVALNGSLAPHGGPQVHPINEHLGIPGSGGGATDARSFRPRSNPGAYGGSSFERPRTPSPLAAAARESLGDGIQADGSSAPPSGRRGDAQRQRAGSTRQRDPRHTAAGAHSARYRRARDTPTDTCRRPNAPVRRTGFRRDDERRQAVDRWASRICGKGSFHPTDASRLFRAGVGLPAG